MVSHEYIRADAHSPPERYDRGLKEEKQRSGQHVIKKSRALNGHCNAFTRKKTYRQKQFLFPLIALVCVFSALDADEMFSRFKNQTKSSFPRF